MSHWNSDVIDRQNPYAAPRFSNELPVTDTSDRLRWWARTMATLQLITICVGVLVAGFTIESILFSGPVVSVFGLLSTIMAIRGRSSKALLFTLFGLSGAVISVVTFLLIAVQQWSPREAHEPVFGLLLVYGLLASPLGLMCVFQRDRNSSAAKPPDSTGDADPSRL